MSLNDHRDCMLGEANEYAVIKLFPQKMQTSIYRADKNHPEFWHLPEFLFHQRFFRYSGALEKCRENLWKGILRHRFGLKKYKYIITMTDIYSGVISKPSFEEYLKNDAKLIYLCRSPESLDISIDNGIRLFIQYFSRLIGTDPEKYGRIKDTVAWRVLHDLVFLKQGGVRRRKVVEDGGHSEGDAGAAEAQEASGESQDADFFDLEGTDSQSEEGGSTSRGG